MTCITYYCTKCSLTLKQRALLRAREWYGMHREHCFYVQIKHPVRSFTVRILVYRKYCTIARCKVSLSRE